MAQYHIINTSSNEVTDSVIWNGDTNVWQPPTGHFTLLDSNDGGGVGMVYNSGGVGVGTTVGDTTYKWRPSPNNPNL